MIEAKFLPQLDKEVPCRGLAFVQRALSSINPRRPSGAIDGGDILFPFREISTSAAIPDARFLDIEGVRKALIMQENIPSLGGEVVVAAVDIVTKTSGLASFLDLFIPLLFTVQLTSISETCAHFL